MGVEDFQKLYDWAMKIYDEDSMLFNKQETVTYCAWCPDPNHPDPDHHPNGQVAHAYVSDETKRLRAENKAMRIWLKDHGLMLIPALTKAGEFIMIRAYLASEQEMVNQRRSVVGLLPVGQKVKTIEEFNQWKEAEQAKLDALNDDDVQPDVVL